MVNENSQRLSLTLSQFRCPTCLFISTDDSLLHVAERCPSCGASGESRRGYPSLAAIRLIDMIQHFYEIANSTHQDELSRATQRINEQIGRSLSAKAVYEGMIRMNRAYAKHRSYDDATGLIASFFRCDQKIAMDILQIYMTSDFDIPEVKVVPVLAVTLVEILLNDILVDLLVKHRHVSVPDGRREVAELGSFDKRYTLFATLVGSDLPAILQKIEKPFWDRWVYIRRKRNYFVHGNPYALGWNACERGFMLTLRSVAAFAQLNNQFVL